MESLTLGALVRGNRNFRNLLAGQFISELGNWFNFIAGLGLVRFVSDASPMAAGLFFVARLLPFALMSPIAGTFVDRFSRRQVMIATDLLRAVIALSFLLVTSAEDLWIAYLATVLLHTAGAFFDGAKNAAAPNLTGKEGLLAGTALLFSSRFLLSNSFSDQRRVVFDLGIHGLADTGRSYPRRSDGGAPVEPDALTAVDGRYISQRRGAGSRLVRNRAS
jgi:MFS family permease